MTEFLPLLSLWLLNKLPLKTVHSNVTKMQRKHRGSIYFDLNLHSVTKGSMLASCVPEASNVTFIRRYVGSNDKTWFCKFRFVVLLKMLKS